MSRTVLRERKARRQYRCENWNSWAHDGTIREGDRYGVVTVFPFDGIYTVPWQFRICAACLPGHSEHDIPDHEETGA